MNDTPALPDSLHWAEGMLLSAQHFQQNDVYWQEHLRYRLAMVNPNFWGVVKLELDMTKLKAGIVEIKKLECVMPDGTPVIFPGSYAGKTLVKDVNAKLQLTPAGVRVSLIFPARPSNSTQVNSALVRHELMPGIAATDEPILMGDAPHDRLPPITGDEPIDRLRPLIKLSTKSSFSPQYVVCPLFEIERRQDSKGIDFKDYHPPMLNLRACDFLRSSSLHVNLLRLNEDLWLKLRELGGNRRDDGPDEDALQSRHVRKHLAMARALATVMPHFSLLVKRDDASPQAVYDCMAQLVGVMASFGANPIPIELEPYQHDNCEPQFRQAMDYIKSKLDYINTSFEYQAFDQRPDGSFAQRLPKEVGDELLVELRLPEGRSIGTEDRTRLAQWLTDACIASDALQMSAARLRVSAKSSLLGADEMSQRNLRSSAAMFVIKNENVQLDDRGTVPLLSPSQILVIKGDAKSSSLKPTMILLYQARK